MQSNSFCNPSMHKRNPKKKDIGRKGVSITEAMTAYLQSVADARSVNTHKTYLYGLNLFKQVLAEHGIDLENDKVSTIDEKMFKWMLGELKTKAPATENLYVTAILGFFEFIYLEYSTTFDISRLYLLRKRRTRREPEQIKNIPSIEISELLKVIDVLPTVEKNNQLNLLNYRDRSFLLLLAGTGLRVAEACKIRLDNINLDEKRIEVMGKGGRIMTARFSKKVRESICDYLALRGLWDGKLINREWNLYLFGRHNDSTINLPIEKSKGISPHTGEAIVDKWVKNILGDSWNGKITPHTFRHYFLTMVLKKTGNVKLVQILANHKQIQTTGRYLHYSEDELSNIVDEF